MAENNEVTIYSLQLARFLTKKGFKFKRIMPDLYHENFNNWVFDNSEELQKAFEEYLALTKK